MSKKVIYIFLGIVLLVGLLMLALFSQTLPMTGNEEKLEGPYACNGDAMICPDGTSVGRQGPSCEFTACPPANATSSRVTTYLGGNPTTLTVSVSPQEVISDSRCPQGVTCIWAGTVEVRTILATPVSHGEHIMTLGKPQAFGKYIVTLIEVSPSKTEAGIPDISVHL